MSCKASRRPFSLENFTPQIYVHNLGVPTLVNMVSTGVNDQYYLAANVLGQIVA